MNLHTPKGASTLGVGVPVDSWMFRERLQVSKPNSSKISLYHCKVIETWMSKMGLHDPFGHLKHKLWPKEGPRIKLIIWLLTTKSQDRFDFLVCKWRATYLWKAFDEVYNFIDFISIGGLHTELWGPKVAKVSTLTISGLPFGSPGTKSHLDVSLVERHRVYYMGEGDGFPQVRAVVNLMSVSCPWLILTPKVLQLCTNDLVLVLCRSVWVVDDCHSS